MGYFGSYFGGGTATYAAASDVRAGVDRGDCTPGTLVVPPAAAVLVGATYDATTAGTVVLPATTSVALGVAFGPGGTDVGELSGVTQADAYKIAAGTVVGNITGTYAPRLLAAQFSKPVPGGS